MLACSFKLLSDNNPNIKYKKPCPYKNPCPEIVPHLQGCFAALVGRYSYISLFHVVFFEKNHSQIHRFCWQAIEQCNWWCDLWAFSARLVLPSEWNDGSAPCNATHSHGITSLHLNIESIKPLHSLHNPFPIWIFFFMLNKLNCLVDKTPNLKRIFMCTEKSRSTRCWSGDRWSCCWCSTTCMETYNPVKG